MSWWTDFRNGLEDAGVLLANYWVPGSGLILGQLASKGSQEDLFGTGWGQAGLALSGLAGGFGGNMGNWGAMFGSAGEASAAPLAEGAAQGFADTGALAAQPAALAEYQQLVSTGMPAQEAMMSAGLTQEQLANAGMATAGDIGTDWGANNYAGSETLTQGANPSGSPYQGTLGDISGGGGWNPVAGRFNAMGTSGGGFGPTGALTNFSPNGTAAMPWGSAASNMNLISGAYGLLQSQRMQQAALAAQRAADPFGPQRGYYADRLRALESNPASVADLPGYNAGMQALQRSMAAQGYTGSGNMGAAMVKFGGDFYNQAMDRYAALAGAQFNPAAGAQLGLQGQQYGTELAGRSLGTLGYAAQMANTYPYQYANYGGTQQRNPYFMGG